MLENLDGFIFRRSAGQGPKVRRILEEGKELSAVRGNTDGIFSFRFVRGGKRKDGEDQGPSAKKAKEESGGCIQDGCEGIAENGMELSIGGGEDFSGSILIKEAPKKKTSASDLHGRLGEDSTLKDLVVLCVEHVLQKKRIEYGVSLERRLQESESFIGKKDVEKEIEKVDQKIVWAEREGEKWNRLKDDVVSSSHIEIREPKRTGRDFGYAEKMEEIDREFAGRIRRLEFLKESARIRISHIKEQSEDLLGKIFKIVCKEKKMDTFFLLKTLSKTSK
ncbi:hypothetical protein [Encephalitozoon cuniculi GB-M1]|uniref:Uncharacterized protein n=1 Tax=Encephalitozoon cuniculi (strain GB-M1) TaxID=284813 RepID=Q8SVJ5_ENCCU|nr:uncharacterized protein ECU05_0880 [Encephalitozoon cuniculi GB-M1]CAD26607.1 hypothetical protein [Encephalitozoon cuniculi GB-M1]